VAWFWPLSHAGPGCGPGCNAVGHTPGTGRHTVVMRNRSKDAPLVAAARRAGVRDPRILDAMAAVPRERFVPEDSQELAVRDRPISIGLGQTTSQPSLIAAMLDVLDLRQDDKVLEIGTGLGYEAALLAHLVAEVHTIERHDRLAVRARENLAACGLDRVNVVVGDGTRGLPEEAPFDAMVIAAAAEQVPAALAGQLVEGGRLIAPVGSSGQQETILYRAENGALVAVRRLMGVRFVPLVAEQDPRA
jgi:protein-L-isoaspartate(D-aspartate) O-methyltransferase